MTRIACLHTAASNVAVLEAAAADIGEPGLVLGHALRDDLLAEMEAAGSLTPAIRARGDEVIAALLAENDAVLITCSSLGALADGRRVHRVDAALAREAVRRGGTVVVLCASPTTIGPTTALFSSAAAEAGASVDVLLVEGAWPLFRSGDIGAYHRRIADEAAKAVDDGADVVALAQVSMSGAAALLPGLAGRVLAAPHAALRALVDMAD